MRCLQSCPKVGVGAAVCTGEVVSQGGCPALTTNCSAQIKSLELKTPAEGKPCLHVRQLLPVTVSVKIAAEMSRKLGIVKGVALPAS